MKGKVPFTAILLAWLIALTSGSAPASPIVSLRPATTSTSIGSKVALNVDISNVSDLYAFQFDIDFNPTVLSAIGITEGAFLPGGGSTVFIPGIIDNAGGTIAFNADTLTGRGPGVNGSGVLAAVDFIAIRPGASSIDLASLIFLDSTGATITISSINGTVDVGSAVITPEPSGRSLLVVGSMALTVLVKRRRRSASTH